jgi:hypothetical protein
VLPHPITSITGRSLRCWPELPIEVTVYKLSDKFIGARSNEFGYANYEVIPEVPELNPLPVKDVLR